MKRKPRSREESTRRPPVRERLLRSGKHLFAKHGYDHTTTISIARAAGTSETQLLSKFGSKEGLLEGIFDADWMRLREQLESSQDGNASSLERLRKIIRSVAEFVDDDPDLKRLLAIESKRIRRGGRYELFVTNGYKECCRMIDEILEQARKDHEIGEDVSPQNLRTSIFGIAFEHWWNDFHTSPTGAMSAEAIVAMTDAFLAGVTRATEDCCCA